MVVCGSLWCGLWWSVVVCRGLWYLVPPWAISLLFENVDFIKYHSVSANLVIR